MDAQLPLGGDGGDVQMPPGDNSRRFYSKRAHKKSRKGCVNCKTRKVKCDEAIPTCRTCFLRGDTCVYAASSSSSTSSTKARRPFTFVQTTFPAQKPKPQAISSSSPSASSSTSRNISSDTSSSASQTTLLRTTDSLGIVPPSQKYDIRDMKLLWNYSMKTMYSFLADEDLQQLTAGLYRVEVVNLAFDAPFLMDSILAVSCLDLARIDPSFTLQQSHGYHVRAVEGFNRAIQEARPEMLPAILVNTVFIGLLTTHTFRDPNAQDLYITEWLVVWRGIGSIVDLVGFEVIFASGLGILLYRPAINLEETDPSIPTNLLYLVSSITPDDEDYLSQAAYMSALRFLGSLYHHLRFGLGSDLDIRITTWFTYLPRAFAILGQQYRPRALVILAHFVCFYKLVKSVWWVQGITDRSIRDICKHLGPEWASALTVPMAVLPLMDKVAVARVLLGDPTWENPNRGKEEMGRDFAYLAEEDQIGAAGLMLQEEQDKDNEQDLQIDTEISRQLVVAHI